MSNPTEDLAASPLKTDPRYGYFPWWPEDGDAWIHPEDVSLARQTIPSPRIWRLEQTSNELATLHVTLHYGNHRLRVRPRLWQQTPEPEFAMGQLVEVLPHGMQNDPVTGHVREIHWEETRKRIIYKIDVVDRVVETTFTADDLKSVEPPRPEPTTRIELPDEASSTYDLMTDNSTADKMADE